MGPNYFAWLSGWKVLLAMALAAVFAFAILWKVPQWQVGKISGLESKDRFDRENEARKTLAQIIGGILVLAGFYATVQNLRVAQKSFDLAQRGQITDRFTKAIEQLGTIDSQDGKKLAVRLGGIYALKRIEAESEGDEWEIKWSKWSIYQVLTAFVRDKAGIGEQHLGKKPDKDIQAIITVLGTPEAAPDAYRDREMDLSETDISGSNLFKNYYEYANFRGAHFHGADLRGAHFNGADFHGADLDGALLDGADLSGADLTDAKNLIQQQIDSTIGDSETKLPSYLHMPDAWKNSHKN